MSTKHAWELNAGALSSQTKRRQTDPLTGTSAMHLRAKVAYTELSPKRAAPKNNAASSAKENKAPPKKVDDTSPKKPKAPPKETN
ncbi:hypothetical protein TNCV_2933991 [Trichonephila clavipes]|nr:hypothetical protein TNCV_2933991 [Trichonephila clavipes]